MKVYYDFDPNHPLTSRLLTALWTCDAETIQEMKSKGMLRKKYDLAPAALVSEYLEDYAKICNTSLRRIIYGSTYSVNPNCTPNDALILDLIDTLSEQELDFFFAHLQAVYPNAYFYDVKESESHNQRIYNLLARLPYGAMQITETADGRYVAPNGKEISKALYMQMTNFIRVHRAPTFHFNCAVWTELASFLGVSLHWLFQFEMPLYCKTVTGDRCFSYYTLLQPWQQERIVDMAFAILESRVSKYTNQLRNRNGTENVTVPTVIDNIRFVKADTHFYEPDLRAAADRMSSCYAEVTRKTAEKVLNLIDDKPSEYRADSFCDLSIYKFVSKMCKRGKDIERLPLVSLISYCSDEYNCSCHSIVFGDPPPTISLQGKAAAYVSYYRALTPAIREQVEAILLQNKEVVKNPLYILKNRVTELAFSQGKSFSLFLVDAFNGKNRWRACDKFIRAVLTPDTEFKAVELGINTSMYWLLHALPEAFHIPVDYLLLQDYSHLAQTDGAWLSDDEKNALSVFLCASTIGQEKALSFLWLAANGSKLDSNSPT